MHDDDHDAARVDAATPPRAVPGPSPGRPGRGEPAGATTGGPGSAGSVGTTTAGPGPAEPSGAPPESPADDPAVDEALARLAELDTLPVREHVRVFEAVHAALQDRLADVED